MRKPEIGDIVLYTDHNLPPLVCPGMIVSMVDISPESGMVNLVVFSDAHDPSRQVYGVRYSAEGQGGTWRWKPGRPRPEHFPPHQNCANKEDT